jgi:hypothetical protein
MYLGFKKQAGSLLLLLFMALTASGQTMHKHKYIIGSPEKKSSISSRGQSFTIHYSISQLDAESLINEHGEWYRISIPGHIKSAGEGKPEVPVLSRMIQIPEGYTYAIKISDVRSERIRPALKKFRGNLFPAQESASKDRQQGSGKFVIDRNSYSSGDLIGSDTVIIEALGRSRGNNLATLHIFPVRYNPRSNFLEVITSMDVEVTFIPGSVLLTKASTAGSVSFSENFEKGILNFGPEDYITGYSANPVRMVILTDTAFVKHLQPLVQWKTQKGFRIDFLYRGADFAGTSYTEIKNSLSTLYNSFTGEDPPPEYLLIVGDVTRIPYYGTGSVTDLYYGEFDGNGDYLPEMFIGRLPVADTSELKSVVSKIIQYEKFHFADTNMFHSRALATAGVDDSHATYMNGQVNYAVTNYLTPENNISAYHFLYPDAKKDSIIKLINYGLSFINYSGHGSSSGWLYLNITSTDLANLQNRNMYPFVISNACQTSRFSTSSFGNRMVLEDEKGGIGFIGCSGDSYWDEDWYWAVGAGPVSLQPEYLSTGPGALDRLFHTNGEDPSEWYFTMGQVNYAGNLAVSSSTSSRKKYYWETYNLVGDPSLIPVIGTPDSLNVQIPDTLPDNITSFSFIAEPFSYAAVSHFDTLWDACHASPSGSVTLQLPGIQDDSCLFVITGQNRIPFIKTVYFSDTGQPFVNLSAWEVNDSLGNSNGKADYDETLFIRLIVDNPGSVDAQDVTARISTASGYVNVISSEAYIGTLAAGSETIIFNDLSFKTNGDIPDNHTVTFDLVLTQGLTEKLYKIDVRLYAPVLEITHYIIDDTETGNGNFIADPGETVNLVFSVMNEGGSSTSGLFSITSSNPEIILIESAKNPGIISSGEIINVSLRVKIAESTPTGAEIGISALFNCDPFYSSRVFTLKVGRIRETFESASFRIFPWINSSEVPWVITETDPFEGIISARSGAITHNQSTSLAIKAIYSDPDTLRFYYKVSSENSYDYLIFTVNDNEVFRKSGIVPWEQMEAAVPAGVNEFKWVFRKDGSVSEGNDCAFLDLIDFADNSQVTYISRDIAAARLVSPVQKTNIGRENVSVRLLNHGPDTIEGFWLAYRVNDGLPVVEHFPDQLVYNSDSVTVTFATRVDLSRFGDYDITVYSFANNDDFLLNDTLRASIRNNNIEGPFLVYPNPFSDELNVIIKSETESEARISLVSSSGKKVIINSGVEESYYLERPLLPGANPLTIRPSGLSQGVYYLSIELPGLTRTMKVIKIRN